MIRRFLPILLLFLALGTAFLLKDEVWATYEKWHYRNSPIINELASDSYLRRILISDGEFEADANSGVYDNKPVVVPGAQLAKIFNSLEKNINVLGESSEEKRIEVDLTTQRLYAYDGQTIKHIFAISSGNPWTPTVTGEFYIWGKVKAQRMSGGSVADGSYYNLPNVPYVMFFHKGYSFHGAYWHNDFGFPRSHGCVNLSIEDAKTLYYWAFPEMPLNKNIWFNIPKAVSTRVVVHGTTPTKLN